MVDCVFFSYPSSILVSREESPGQRKVKPKGNKQASKNESGSDERRTAPQGG